MRLLAIGEKESGCDYHRIFLPVSQMTCDRKLITNDFSEERLSEGWDVVFCNRGIDGYTAQQVSKLRAKYGFKFVMDMDDYWRLDYHHVLFEQYEKGLTQYLIDFMKMADVVTVTHDRLARCARIHNKNVAIYPNAIPFGEHQFTDKKDISSKQVRIGWCGSITHEKDIRLLAGPVQKLMGMKDQIRMCIGGYDDGNAHSKDIWDRMVSAYTFGLKIPGMILPSRSVYEYMDMYDVFDLMLIPLQDTMFNNLKSNLKVLEAASKKIPVIVSHIDPYLNLPDSVCYVKKQSDWFTHINRLVRDPYERKDRGEALYQWAKENYNLKNHKRDFA